MKAAPGDWLMIEGTHLDEPKRHGLILEVHGPEGVETGEITEVGTSTETPAGTFADTLTVLEDGPSLKKYARGIGEIYDDGVELVSY